MLIKCFYFFCYPFCKHYVNISVNSFENDIINTSANILCTNTFISSDIILWNHEEQLNNIKFINNHANKYFYVFVIFLLIILCISNVNRTVNNSANIFANKYFYNNELYFVFLQRLHINIILRGIEKIFLFPLLSIINLFLKYLQILLRY